MKSSFLSALTGLLLLCVLSLSLSALPVSAYRIAVARGATPAEEQASLELQELLEKSCGVRLDRIPYDASLTGPLFVVGPTAEGMGLCGVASLDAMKPDEIHLKTVGERLYLFGARPRATLYAVYEFLERSIGVKWLSPEATHIPLLSGGWEVPVWDYCYAPSIYVRAVSTSTNGGDPAFHSHMRGNGQYQPNDIRYGGFRDLAFLPWFVHTFQVLIPHELYFDEHPEWFSYRRGKFFLIGAGRQRNSQLCISNPELRKEVVRRALEGLRSVNGEMRFLSISQNDNEDYCLCKKCTEMAEELGNVTDVYMTLVNEVAEAVEKEFPHVLVETLAYKFTRQPPKTVMPRDNVAVRLCTIEASSFHNLDDPEGPNHALYEDFEGWAPVAKQLLVWDYTIVFRKLWQPHPNWNTFAPNLRFFRDHGVISVYEQNGSGPNGGKAADLPELRSWVLSKLMWNPDQEVWTLIDEFLEPFYGPCAPFVRKYLQETCALADGKDGCYTVTTKWLPDEVLQELWLEGEALYQEYATDPVYGSRIMAAVLPLAMSAAERGLLPPEPWTFQEYADELVRRLDSLGITTLTEHATTPGYTPEKWRKHLRPRWFASTPDALDAEDALAPEAPEAPGAQ